MIARRARPRFTVRLEVPRAESLRAWGAVAADFERSLAEQVSPVVSEARVESETRRGPDSVRVRIAVTAGAADVGQAAVIAWDVFRTAAGEDIAAWDVNAATAEVRPADSPLCPRVWAGDADTAAAQLGRAVALAHQGGNQDTAACQAAKAALPFTACAPAAVPAVSRAPA